MKEKEIYLLRHGDTGYSGRYIGSSNVPLSPLGVEQVKRSCSFLSTLQFDELLCSPMLRCVETSGYLSNSVDVKELNLLKEIDFGRWEKKTFEEIKDADGPLVESWVRDSNTFSFPGGESMSDFRNRVTAVHDYLAKTASTKILLVCHGGVIRHLICLLLRIPIENYLLFEIDYGRFSTVRLHSQGGVLTGLNLRGY